MNHKIRLKQYDAQAHVLIWNASIHLTPKLTPRSMNVTWTSHIKSFLFLSHSSKAKWSSICVIRHWPMLLPMTYDIASIPMKFINWIHQWQCHILNQLHKLLQWILNVHSREQEYTCCVLFSFHSGNTDAVLFQCNIVQIVSLNSHVMLNE